MMEASGYHERPMANENRKRVALSLDESEVARAEKIAGVVPVASWSTIIVRREIERIEAGQIAEIITESERDALRALRALDRDRDATHPAITGLIGMSFYSDALRRDLRALADETFARLEGRAPEAPSKPPTSERPAPEGHRPKGKG